VADQPHPPDQPNPAFPEYRIDIEPEFVAIEVELPSPLHLTDTQLTHLEARLYDAIEVVLSSAIQADPPLPEPDWDAWEASFTTIDPIDLV
jgi:hypothetical protein